MSTILALDIGTEFVKAVMAKTSKQGDLEIIGAGKSRQSPSNMYAGAISDIPGVIAACEKALILAEEEARETAKLTVVGIAGELVKGETTTVNYSRENPNKPISEIEMEEIVKKVQRKTQDIAQKAIAAETGNENVQIRLINSAIISLTIDGYKISNPIGFKGTNITIQFYTAFAPLTHVSAIEKVCAELNLDLLAVAVEPFAICRAFLGNDLDSDFSGLVMDIGGGTTDIALVSNGCVEGTKMFSIGGRSFTHQIAESLGTDFETAEKCKLSLEAVNIDDHLKARIETAVSKNISVWLTGIEVAIEDFNTPDSLPRNILLCGGGASLSMLQESLAISDWYTNLPFTRRPIIHLIDTQELPNLNIKTQMNLDHSFVTAIGLLRVGEDTLIGSPENDSIKVKISKILQK